MEIVQQNNYLLTEPVKKLLPKFIVPCVISLIISCLYNIVDQIFIGNSYLGYLGNAATGIIFPITVVGWALSLLFGDGAAAYLSLAQGSVSINGLNTKDLGKTIANSILFSFLTGAVLIVISYMAGDTILYSLGATDATIKLTRDYGGIIFIMIPLALAQNTMAGIIRADGSPRYAMMAMAVGAVLNIILDPLTIFVLGWGIKGAAYATIFGQFVSFVICAVYLRKSKMFRLRAADFIPNLKSVSRVLPLGGSSFLTQIAIVIVTVVNNKLLVSYGALSEYGADIPLAAFVVIMKLFQIIINIAIGIAAGAQPVIGFNYGAKHYDRVREAFKYVMFWTITTSAIATIIFEVFPGACIALFGSDGELYTSFAIRCVRIYLAFIIFTCVQKACAIFLQSIGKASAAIPLSMIRDVVFLIIFTFALPAYFGVTGIFWAAPHADILALLITIIVVMRVWKGIGKAHISKTEATETAEVITQAALRPSRPGVIITIAREHGSDGRLAGLLVAEKLGIPCYYKEMTSLAGEESGLAAEFISSINAASPAGVRDMYLDTDIVRQAIVAQGKAIQKIADAGSCVIVGRAADYVLKGNENLVRVFIHAPEEHRIKEVMKVYGVTEDEARKQTHAQNAARAAYHKHLSGNVWGDSRQYELCIDSSRGAEKTAALICEYVKAKA
ncbi:hypothetical protein AGMMS49546_27790 [Spirochaetia bacterium]|nr:hypothetical protein AGMMS49546_27790 [Spirochaetia bacterium]